MLRRVTAGGSRIASLAGEERRRFFAFARNRLQRDLALLKFAMPLLFLVGWIRDYVVDGDRAVATLPLRVAMCALLLLAAALLATRRLRRWQEAGNVAYLVLFGACIALTTIQEPARLSLVHVVIALMLIIWLRFSLRARTAAGVILALCLPLAGILFALRADPALWIAYALFAVMGICIGLASRRTHLEGWLDLFRIRHRLLLRLHRDSLTGVANRDAWQATATLAHARAMQAGHPVCVVFFDLDHFKAINDRHGHAAGDAILRDAAQAMRTHLRKGDLVARIGGEEFVALLAGAALEDAIALAERVRASVQALPAPFPVTLSAGVACAGAGESLESLTARADHALLMAKRSGRNRVCRDDAPPLAPMPAATAQANDTERPAPG